LLSFLETSHPQFLSHIGPYIKCCISIIHGNKESSVYTSPFLATESADGTEREMPWHERMSCEGLPYGGIWFYRGGTAKYGTAPGGVAIHTELKQEGKNQANTQ